MIGYGWHGVRNRDEADGYDLFEIVERHIWKRRPLRDTGMKKCCGW